MTESNTLTQLQALTSFFEGGCKHGACTGYGVEVEHIAVRSANGTAVPYSGAHGIEQILLDLAEVLAAARGEDLSISRSEGRPVGLFCSDYSITLEPAAQFEISIRPCIELAEIAEIYETFCRQIEPVFASHNAELRRIGYQPVSCVNDLELIPKARYLYMDRFFQTSGRYGRNMMRGTASTQVSIDYNDEADFVRKFRLAYMLGPIFSLLTDNTPVFEGRPVSGHLMRTQIWRSVDPARCGIIPNIESDGFGFASYASFLLNMPLILRADGTTTVPVGNRTAKEAYEGESLRDADLQHIVSMDFPDVRLKQYIEIRMADSLPQPLILAYAALIKGIFRHDETVRRLNARFPIDVRAITAAQDSLIADGFAGTIYGTPAAEAARFLLDEAKKNLPEQEQPYLDPFFICVQRGKTWAEEPFTKSIDCGRKDVTSNRTNYDKPINREWKQLILTDLAASRKGAEEAASYLKNSPEINRGKYLHELTIPKIYEDTDIRRFAQIVETTDRILTKITEAYLTDPAYRARFPFSRELTDLILSPRGYKQMIPMARYDIFYQEETGDFKFCEINTDGTSAMNEDAVCLDTLPMIPAFRQMRERYSMTSFELFDSWVQAFSETYDSYENRKDDPYIGIVDFLEEACLNEFQVFADHFRKAGFRTEICEIRDLTFDGTHLISPTGHVIDAVYRRAVTGDVERHLPEVDAFCRAVRARAVCVIGAFCTQIAHHKTIFRILREEASLALLSPAERQFVLDHVPATYALNAEICRTYGILSDKDHWIIKPCDSYASRGVCAGVDVSAEEWSTLLPRHFDDDFIVQEYCTPYAVDNICLSEEECFKPYNNMPGLFAYNGKLAGIYSRFSDGGIISSQTNKKVAPTLWLHSDCSGLS